jgi:hypothetical protein
MKAISKRETTPKSLLESRHQNPFPRSIPKTHPETHPESGHLGLENPDTRVETHLETAPRSTPDIVRQDLLRDKPRKPRDGFTLSPENSPISIRKPPQETADTVTEQAPIYSTKDLAGLNGKGTEGNLYHTVA